MCSVSILKVDLDTLRLTSEEAFEQNKKWKEEILEQNVSPLIVVTIDISYT